MKVTVQKVWNLVGERRGVFFVSNTWAEPFSQLLPSTNISLEGNSSSMWHSKPSISILYSLHNGIFLGPEVVSEDFPPPTTVPSTPTARSSNRGTFPDSLKTCPMAYFSPMNNRAISGEVTRTVEVAVQIVRFPHNRSTLRV
jgi:hypothetical protein